MRQFRPACAGQQIARHAGGAMSGRAEVPGDIVAKLRALRLALPAAYEETAWAGTRWKIGRHNFAHVVAIDAGWPPAYAKAAGSRGPLVVVTFRVPASKLETARFTQGPYFKPVWWPDIAGMTIDADTDWHEIEMRVTDSYRTLAPKRLLNRSTDSRRRNPRSG